MSTKEKQSRGPWVWIDLEMTGLDLKNDTILEIATIVTDNKLEIIAEGPNLIIHCPELQLKKMDTWCTEHHTKSGLWAAAASSTVTQADAEALTFEFLRPLVEPAQGILCGNSIWQDRLFMSAHMPNLLTLFNYRMIDVSSIKEVISSWYPKNSLTKFKKKDTHRALPDILESIQELRHYQNNFFINTIL